VKHPVELEALAHLFLFAGALLTSMFLEVLVQFLKKLNI
jgi:hypothetical protein